MYVIILTFVSILCCQSLATLQLNLQKIDHPLDFLSKSTRNPCLNFLEFKELNGFKMSSAVHSWLKKVYYTRLITAGLKNDLLQIDKLYTGISQRKHEIYNYRKVVDLEYVSVGGDFFFCFFK